MSYSGYEPEADKAYRERARDIVHRLFNDVVDGYFMVFNGTYMGKTGKWAVTVHPKYVHIPGRIFSAYDNQFRNPHVGMILITDHPQNPSLIGNSHYMHGTPVYETTLEELEDYNVFEELNAFPDDHQPLIGIGHNSEQYTRVLTTTRALATEIRNLPQFGGVANPDDKLLVLSELDFGHLRGVAGCSCGFQCIPPTHTDFKSPIVLISKRPPF